MIKKIRNCLWIILGISVICPGKSQGYFEITPQIKEAYNAALSLRFEDAKEHLADIKTKTPDNLMIHQVENYIDFFTIFINEEKDVFDALYSNKKKRLDALKKGDRSSPYYLFVQAEIYLQWALVKSKFLKSTSGIGAFDMTILNDANRAYKLLSANEKAFPDFIENQKSLGVMHALAAYLPKFVRFLFSVDGSLEQGRSEIEELIHFSAQNNFMYSSEVYVIYAYMMMDLFNDPETAWQTLVESKFDYTENPLARFVLASLAQKTGRNDEIIHLLETPLSNGVFYSFYYLDFLLGKAYLRKLDPRAKTHILHFLNNFNGRHFIKEAYQKLAWYNLAIEEDSIAYVENIAKCMSEGYRLLEDDQQAQKEAQEHDIPHPTLLKARLLFDGGYYEDALELLNKNKSLLTDTRLKKAYLYRIGRIYQMQKKFDDARKAYLETLAINVKGASFFDCNAALQLGQIYAYFNDTKSAKKYFKLCRKTSSDKYEKHLHNKAKAGLDRLKIKD